MTALDQRVPSGRGCGLPAGAFAEGKGQGQGRDSGLLNNPLFGERAALAASHDPVTDFDVLHI